MRTVPATARSLFERMPIVTVDRPALQANWRTLDAAQPSARTGAAVKADGYGLGAAKVATSLYDVGCRDFFVAWTSEGIDLRCSLSAHHGVVSPNDRPRIFILQGLERYAVEANLEHDLIPVLSTRDDIAVWLEGLRTAGQRASAAVQFESGMNRLGLEEAAAREAAAHFAAGDLPLVLVMSHLASADTPSGAEGLGGQSGAQRQRFIELAALFPTVPRSLANSAATLLSPDYGFELTRPGIALYGGGAGPQSRGRLRAVATLTAAVLQVRTAAPGEQAGYGGAAKLTRGTRIATVGLGYADGYHRATSGAGVNMRDLRPGAQAFVGGHRVPVLGRISMDLTLLDVTGVPEDAVRPGERAEFFGENVPIDEVAAAAGTIAYELLTGLGPRVFRDWR